MSEGARILAVCTGPGGIPKRPVREAQLGEPGLEGDSQRHKSHGGARRALCLLSREEVAQLEADGVPFAGPGQYGENVLTEGIDFGALGAGDRLALGDEVEIELTEVREPCGVLRSIDRRFPRLMLGRSGFMARVVRGGGLRAGLAIARR